jgi:predicted DNA-binding transcriptional regulator AlpA
MSEAIKREPVKRAPRGGTAVIWAKGVEERYGITAPTRWRWEKDGRLPARDVNVGGKRGWRPETLAAAETRDPTQTNSNNKATTPV